MINGFLYMHYKRHENINDIIKLILPGDCDQSVLLHQYDN